MKTHQNKLHVIHMIDSIYLGQLNNSYQKDGFGIQQTFEFDTYIGYWKSNKAEGIGLVILQDGTRIYANFIRDQIDGLAIIDNGERLRCGIYRGHQIVGVGFQYNYSLKIWRMNRYHKGIAIQTVKQQVNDLTSSLPKIINVQQSIYFHMFNYLNKTYFPQLEMTIVEEIAENTTFYGYKNSKGYFGPGVTIQNYSTIQAGFYEEGDLHGFGFKKSFDPFHYQFGCYHKGRKDGIFLEKNSDKINFYEYRKNILLKNVPDSQKSLLNSQKKYNFNCKDFYSSKNNVPFQTFKKISTPPQVRQFNDKKGGGTNEKQKKIDIKGSLSKKNEPKSPPAKTKTDYIIRQDRQKTSLQIMRQKMSQYYGMVGSSKKRTASIDSSPNAKSNKKKQVVNSDQDDEVARQQNPFVQHG